MVYIDFKQHLPTQNVTHRLGAEQPTENGTHRLRMVPTDSERHPRPAMGPTNSVQNPLTQNATHQLRTAPNDSDLTSANLNCDTIVLQQPPQTLECAAVRQIKTNPHNVHYRQYKTDILPYNNTFSRHYNTIF